MLTPIGFDRPDLVFFAIIFKVGQGNLDDLFFIYDFDCFHFFVSVRGCIASRLYLKDTKLNLDCQAQNQVRGENNFSDTKAGQAEPHFLPALVPLCRSIANLLILSIWVVLIRYRFYTITLLYIEDLAPVNLSRRPLGR
jgi:hypothetical protein